MLGAVLVAAGMSGFGRCSTCRRYRQLSHGNGLVQCGNCWCRQSQDLMALDHASP
jgi:hypothetical protein